MRDLARLAVCVPRVAKAVAADAGVRMNLAILAQLAGGAEEYVRMQNAARTDLGPILDDPVGANQAVIANIRARSDDAIGTQKHALAEYCIAMHHCRRVALAPLRKAARFAVEILQKNCHSHGNILDGETASFSSPVCAQQIGHIGVHDENGGLMAPRLTKLRNISDIHQALAPRFFRNVAMSGGRFPVAVEEGEDIRVVILDGLSV